MHQLHAEAVCRILDPDRKNPGFISQATLLSIGYLAFLNKHQMWLFWGILSAVSVLRCEVSS